MTTNPIFLVIGIVLILLSIVVFYNKGVSLRNYVKEAFSTMDVYLKKRWDLIPNLVETVKGYMSFEKETLENITKLRNTNYSSLSNESKIELNNKLSDGLSKLIATFENYPDLKSNETFKQLMAELSKTEEDIANSRKYYNATVREFNTFTEVFPTNLISKLFGFKAQAMFEIDETERQNIKVGF